MKVGLTAPQQTSERDELEQKHSKYHPAIHPHLATSSPQRGL